MRKLAIGFIGIAALAGCGGEGATSTASTPPAAAAPQASPTPAPVSISVNAVADSGASGTAEIVRAAGSFTLTVRLKGLAPSTSHVSHIHTGSCTANGGIAIPLQTLTADASGAATATTSINQEFTVPAAGWYVNVHAGSDLQGANAKAIACGNVPPV